MKDYEKQNDLSRKALENVTSSQDGPDISCISDKENSSLASNIGPGSSKGIFEEGKRNKIVDR